MNEVSIIGLDLAKNVFQAYGAGADGSVIFRRKLSRSQLLKFRGDQPLCTVAMGLARAPIVEVRLISPTSFKPFVKRQKNDKADAEAIAGAASRPTMRFVAVESEDQQGAAMVYRIRDLLVRRHDLHISIQAHGA